MDFRVSSQNKPFTYLIGWSEHQMFYYGVRYSKKACDPSSLWTTYFTSSVYVRKFRELHGEPDIIQVRRVFETKEHATAWEFKVLKRIRAAQSTKFLNRTNAPAVSTAGYKFDPEVVAARNKKISETLTGHKDSDEVRLAKSIGHIGIVFTEEHCQNISKSRKGIIFSEEHRRNSSKARTGVKRGPYKKRNKPEVQ